MAKKKRTWLIISLFSLLIIVALFAGYFSIQQTALFDDYTIEEDFKILSPVLATIGSNCNVDSSVCEDTRWRIDESINYPGRRFYVSEENLILTAIDGDRNKVTFKVDLKGRDVKFRIFGGESSKINDFYSENNVYFGDSLIFQKKGTFMNGEFFVEILIDPLDKTLYHVNINGEENVKTVKIISEKAFLVFETYMKDGFAGTSSITIDYIKSKPYFSCEITSDEIVFTDRYVSGTKIKYVKSENDPSDVIGLTHKPLKLCPKENPVKFRSIKEGAERADTLGVTFDKLIHNEIITVPPDELMEVRYIVDFKEGMSQDNCGIDGYYSYPEGCKKIVFEKTDIIQFTESKEFIIVGKNELVFQDSIQVFDKVISLGSPQFSCENEEVKTSYASNCLSSSVNYDGKTYVFNDNQVIDLDTFFNLKWTPSVTYKDGNINTYMNRAILGLKNRDMLKIEFTQDKPIDYFVIFGSNREFTFTINNQYGDIDNSGIILTTNRLLLEKQTTESISIPFKKGITTYTVKIPSDSYGGVQFIATPYFYIGNEIFYDDERISKNYEVVAAIPSETTIVEKEVLVEKIIEIIKTVEIINNVEVIKEVPVEKIIETEKIVETVVTKEIPITKEIIVEKLKEVPIEKILTKEVVVEKVKEVPVEKIITKTITVKEKGIFTRFIDWLKSLFSKNEE